ncbi:MAG: anaerobic ribonucleoside-triphosphate reductase activating protein [Eubacteriales bacterium]
MKIQGIQRVSLLDFPELVACTVFTGGCNFRCPFCHNASLVLPGEMTGIEIEENDFFAFLDSRKNKLDGVCISGGEPLLQPDLENFVRRIRKMGFAVKIDTNGSMPEQLKKLVNTGLIDYVAMDIKNSPEHYALTAGLKSLSLEKICESVSFLLTGAVQYEFRTTLVRELHNSRDMEQIGRWLKGAHRYYLQEFVDSGDLIGADLHACSQEETEFYLRIAGKYIPSTQLRGA